MKILNKLTLKHLSKNKKRTIVSIIGVILSTALMVGIGLIVSSVIYTSIEDVKESTGDHHVVLTDVNLKNLDELENVKYVENIEFVNDLGYADVSELSKDETELVHVQSLSLDRFAKIDLKEGRYPENNKEIIVSRHFIDNSIDELKINDTITFNIGSLYDQEFGDYRYQPFYYYSEDEGYRMSDLHESSYKIVGVMSGTNYMRNTQFEPFYSGVDLNSDTVLNAYVRYDNPRKTLTYNDELSTMLDIEPNTMRNNDWLLRYYGVFGPGYGGFRNVLMGLMILMLAIVSIGCATVIYNSFAISTLERKKQFGLYASIGTTKQQIRNSVYFEALIVGVIGIVLGTLSGFLGIFVTLKVINNILASQLTIEFMFHANWVYVLIPILFMIVVIIVSAYFPARQAASITPIEAIRQTDDIKISKNEIKKSWFARKLSIFGQLAHKNMQRNKGKYRVTIVSLFISVVLFVSFSTFGEYTNKAISLVEQTDYDVFIGQYGDSNNSDKEIKDIIAKYNVDEQLKTQRLTFSIDQLPKEVYSDEYLESSFIEDLNNQNDSLDGYAFVEFRIVPNDTYKKYIKDIKAEDGQTIILNHTVERTFDDGNKGVVEYDMFKNNDFILTNKNTIDSLGLEDELPLSFDDIVLTDKEWFGFRDATFNGTLTAIISEEMALAQNFDKVGFIQTITYLKTSEFEEIYNEISDLSIQEVHVTSPKIEQRDVSNMFLAAKILIYGFIALVTLIGVTSVFNTIYTNIMLRKREFAVLRSIGMDPKGMNRMLFDEMLFVGLKALLYSLPVALVLVVVINKIIGQAISISSIIIPYKAIVLSILGVFILVWVATAYSRNLIKDENILDSMKEENI